MVVLLVGGTLEGMTRVISRQVVVSTVGSRRKREYNGEVSKYCGDARQAKRCQDVR